MARAFEPHLDILIVEARNIVRNRAIFRRNLPKHLRNAVSFVKLSSRGLMQLEAVKLAGNRLAKLFDPSAAPLGPAIDASVTAFVAAVDALRNEMSNCPPSEKARTLGLE